MVKILGIDPALSCLGWGVIQVDTAKTYYVASGIVRTNSKDMMQCRLINIADRVMEVIQSHKPDLVAMEETFVNVNALSSLKLAYVRGALMYIIGKTKLPYFEFLPNKIKKTIVGVGHAEKEQVKRMVSMIIVGGPSDISFDEADALAIAYTCSVHYRP